MLSFLLYALAGVASSIALIVLGAALCFALNLVPASRAQASGLSLVAWALYGNDDGGLYGERDNWGVFLLPEEQTVATAFRWWLRNPLHNVTHHVLKWYPLQAYVGLQFPSRYEPQGFFYRAPRNWVTERGASFQITFLPIFVSWRALGWEGYAGWRESGELGFALRKSSNP